jgi:hypothetical protein
VRQFKTFCQFEHRYVWDVRISLVTKNFFQKEDILEYSSGHCFFVTPSHKDLLINQKKALHRLNDERLCSTDGNAADNKLKSNGYATVIWEKDFLATVLFLLGSS